MTIWVHEVRNISDADLPVAELAASMRLADGFGDVPGQSGRLRQRLRAATSMIEARIGRIVFSREVVLLGLSTGSRRLALPVSPVSGIVAVEAIRDGSPVTLGEAAVEAGDPPFAILSEAARLEETIRMTVRAGYAGWADVPEAIAQAILSTAEALDEDRPAQLPMVDRLLAPFRAVRIGGRR